MVAGGVLPWDSVWLHYGMSRAVAMVMVDMLLSRTLIWGIAFFPLAIISLDFGGEERRSYHRNIRSSNSQDRSSQHSSHDEIKIIATTAALQPFDGCMISDVDTTLRHRTTQHSVRPNNNIQPNQSSPSHFHHHHMAYSRRNIAASLSRGGNNSPIPNGKSKTSYRNTILAILVLTSFYTAFLYQRGVSCVMDCCSLRLQWIFISAFLS